MMRPGTSRRGLLLLGLLACALTLPASYAATAGTGRVRPQLRWWSTSTPLPPPPMWASPQALRHFHLLFVAYSHLPPVNKPSFCEWLDLNGVTDVHLKAQLLALYAWYVGRLHGTPGVG